MNDLKLASRPFWVASPEQTQAMTVAWSRKLVLLAIAVTVVATLYPFKFALTGPSILDAIAHNFRSRSSLLDVVANIVLFLPLGFGLGGILANRNLSLITRLLTIAIVAGGFSFLIEILQVFLPDRRPTPLDVVSNTLGGLVGGSLFQVVGRSCYAIAGGIVQRIRQRFPKIALKYLIVALGCYVVLVGGVVFSWPGASLNGWYDGFPLSIGNNFSFYHPGLDREINTAWQGAVADVVLRDRAVSRAQAATLFAQPSPPVPNDQSIIAAYSLRGTDGTQDSTGHSPHLEWQGTTDRLTGQGAAIADKHWLQTPAPMEWVTQRIRNTSQFTISATMSAHSPSDTGGITRPILAMATPLGDGNVALAQTDSDLNLMLGIRRARRFGLMHWQRCPNVFQDQQPHRIVVTYSGFVARVYVDSAEQAYVFDMTPNRFQIILFLLVLAPLASLIALVAHRVYSHRGLYLLVIVGGTLLPALVLEGALASEGDRTMRLANLLLGMVTVGVTLFVFKPSRRSPHRRTTFSH